MAPVEVGGEPHGRLRSYVLAEALEPAESILLQGLFWLTLAIILVVLIDLVARGRFRTISSALARMLAAFGPLLGVYGAANILMKASLDLRFTHIPPDVIGQSAMLIAVGALCGCVGVVLAAGLRIVPVKPTATRRSGQAEA